MSELICGGGFFIVAILIFYFLWPLLWLGQGTLTDDQANQMIYMMYEDDEDEF